jgi:hypothetical protein
VLALIISACGVSRGSDLAAASITFSDGSTVSIDGNEFREVSGSIRGSEDFLALSGLPADTIDTLSLTQMVQAEVVTHLLDINGASISSSSSTRWCSKAHQRSRGKMVSQSTLPLWQARSIPIWLRISMCSRC